jgi:signal transduction histidine kinase
LELVGSFERTKGSASDPLNVFNVTDGLGIYEENPNPVLRISNNGIILYANQGSQFLCRAWDCGVGDFAPEIYRQRIDLVRRSGKSQSYREEIDGCRVVLQVVPVAERDYVDVFGYCMPEIEPTAEKRKVGGPLRPARNGTRNKRRTEFARAAVHELRNPLTPILAASEMLVNRLGEDGIQARLARQINAGAIELNARIGELFELVQAEMGAFALDYRPVNLEELLIEIIKFLQPGADNKGVTFVLEVDENLREINADRGRLREALGYLLANAINRCPAKAIISINVIINLSSLLIKINVTCMKIPAAISQYLSMPYSTQAMDRAHFSSVGLKLTLAKLLIELHGGDIHVESDSDNDTFIVKIPLEST